MKTIEYKVSYEKMISRLPGLFAYLEWNDYGEVSLHKATDSLDGCWGKIVENIKLPENVNLNVNLKDILLAGEVYSYRTIIDFYYQYKNELDNDDQFKLFIEEAIGRVEVPKDIRYYHSLKEEYQEDVNLPLIITERDYQSSPSNDDKEKYTKKKFEFVAMPEFLYLSNVKHLYDELVKMDRMCEFYEYMLDNNLTEKDKHLCCLCERYEEMGGDMFKEYVATLIPKAEEIAEKYKTYAENAQYEEKIMTLDFDIDLVSSYQDYGIMTPYAPIWIPGKKYHKGDKVEYDGELYICKEENSGVFDEDLMRIVFVEQIDDNILFEKYNGAFIDESNRPTSKTIRQDSEVWYDGEAIKHISHIWDKDKTVHDYSILSTNGDLTSPILIKGQTDSKLVGLRRFATYYNDDNVPERPNVGEDWLFYYRKGVVVNIRTINDELGNIAKLSSAKKGILETARQIDTNDLAAYGDIIENINYLYTNGLNVITNEQYDNLQREEKNSYNLKNVIRFTYRVGVHLNGEGGENTTDEDGNDIITWKNFVWDENDKIGIKYEEEYNYKENGDLDNLINRNIKITLNDEDDDPSNDNTVIFNFNDYIEGKYDKKIPTYKFEFTTIDNAYEYTKTIAHQEANILSILTDFEIYRNDFQEFEEYDLIREEYLNGITYKPTKDIDVRITRGSTSAFEKHMAFGEIKTMEDMENHSGTIFKMAIS